MLLSLDLRSEQSKQANCEMRWEYRLEVIKKLFGKTVLDYSKEISPKVIRRSATLYSMWAKHLGVGNTHLTICCEMTADYEVTINPLQM